MRTLGRDGDKLEVLRRVKEVRPDADRRWGKMSAHQMICHLSDGFRMATGEKEVSHLTSLPHRTIVKWIALYAPMRWPAGIATRPEVDQLVAGTRLGDFTADVAELEHLLEAFSGQAAALDGLRHPTFGRMSGKAWLRWGYLHVDHHLRQFGT